MKRWLNAFLITFISTTFISCGGGDSKSNKADEPTSSNSTTKKLPAGIASTFIVDKTIFVEFQKPISELEKEKFLLGKRKKARSLNETLTLKDKNGKFLKNVTSNLSFNNKLLSVYSQDMQPNQDYTLTLPKTKTITQRSLTYKTKIRLTKTGQNISYKNFDDGYYRIGKKPNFERNNDIVTDHVSSLIWKDDVATASKTFSQQGALEYCASLGDGWRLPNIEELRTIIDYSIRDRAINEIFVNLGNEGFKGYWTSSKNLQQPKYGILVNFTFGSRDSAIKSKKYYARCVKGDKLLKTEVQSHDDTALDADTGLTWRDKVPMGRRSWGEALAYCNSLGDKWRLPNIRELLSIANADINTKPSLKPGFTQKMSGQFWASTTTVDDIKNAWGVDFNIGGDFIHEDKNNEKNLVRCVRGYEIEDVITPTDKKAKPPVADAGVNQNVNEGQQVTLNASGSKKGDANIISYEWFENSQSIGTGATLEYLFSKGKHTVLLKVTDEKGLSSEDAVVINVLHVNKPPVANAGENVSLNKEKSITLDASKSKDSDGRIVSYEWKENEQIIGENVKLTKRFTFGTHVITLKVTDNKGASAEDSVKVVVIQQALKPLVANAGANQSVTQGESVTLSASAIKDDSIQISSYEWIENGNVIGSQQTLTKIFAVGVHTITLKVTDSTGATDTDEVIVSVIAKNTPPIADAGANKTYIEDESITLDGSGSSDDKGIVSYKWYEGNTLLGEGETYTISSSQKLSIGTHTITLKVKDANNEENEDTVVITIEEKNKPPKAVIADGGVALSKGASINIIDGDDIYLDGSKSSDPNNNIIKYEWLEEGVVLATGETAQITQKLAVCAHTIVLKVTDAGGLSSQTNFILNIEPKKVAPIANAGADKTYVEDERITLDGSKSTDEDGQIVTYEWYKGGTLLGKGVKLNITLPIGVHVISLKVKDNDGKANTNTATVTIKVVAPKPPENLKVLKTGQKTCYTQQGSSWVEASCDESSTTGQDGRYQYGDYQVFTRENDIVTDHSTGLQWRDDEQTETYFLKGAGSTFKYMDAKRFCLGGAFEPGWKGFKDWRVPSDKELASIFYFGKDSSSKGKINKIFKYTGTSYMARNYKSNHIWYINFKGQTFTSNKNVRCVRGTFKQTNKPLIRDDSTKTVYDPNTDLMWIDDANLIKKHRSLQKAQEYCESLNLKGLKWRVPNIKELQSIEDWGNTPVKMKNIFKHCEDSYLSSTTETKEKYPNMFLGLSFKKGGIALWNKNDGYPANFNRCVSSANVLATGQTTEYKANDDGDLQKGLKREVALKKALVLSRTVADKTTGLEWQDNTRASTNWEFLTFDKAVENCQKLNLFGQNWRLPSYRELKTLVFYGKKADNENVLFDTFKYVSSNKTYWTKSPFGAQKDKAWVVSFDTGEDIIKAKSDTASVMCVRDL